MGFVYIIQCRDGKLYTGSTLDVVGRFAQHCRGEVKFTSRRRPLQLAWTQEFGSLEEAYIVEHQIKGWSRAKKVALIEGRLTDLPQLAKRGSSVARNRPSVRTQRDIAARTNLVTGNTLPREGPRLATRPTDAMSQQRKRTWSPRAANQDWSTYGPHQP